MQDLKIEIMYFLTKKKNKTKENKKKIKKTKQNR